MRTYVFVTLFYSTETDVWVKLAVDYKSTIQLHNANCFERGIIIRLFLLIRDKNSLLATKPEFSVIERALLSWRSELDAIILLKLRSFL